MGGTHGGIDVLADARTFGVEHTLPKPFISSPTVSKQLVQEFLPQGGSKAIAVRS